MLCEIKGGTVTRGGQTVLSHFDFFIRGSEKIAVVGRNGAGKTTLLEVLSGIRELDPDEKHPEAGMSKSRKFSVGFLRQQTEPEMLGRMTQAAFRRIRMQMAPAVFLRNLRRAAQSAARRTLKRTGCSLFSASPRQTGKRKYRRFPAANR